MKLSLELPDQIAHSLHLEGPHSTKRHLEILALEGYRSGELSRGQVSELLGIGFDETEVFLKEHGANLGLTLQEIEQDSDNLRKFLSQ